MSLTSHIFVIYDIMITEVKGKVKAISDRQTYQIRVFHIELFHTHRELMNFKNSITYSSSKDGVFLGAREKTDIIEAERSLLHLSSFPLRK